MWNLLVPAGLILAGIALAIGGKDDETNSGGKRNRATGDSGNGPRSGDSVADRERGVKVEINVSGGTKENGTVQVSRNERSKRSNDRRNQSGDDSGGEPNPADSESGKEPAVESPEGDSDDDGKKA